MWLSGLYSKRGKSKFDLEEFRKIFLDFYPDLCLYASKFVGDAETSKDIVQEVMATFWEENEKLLNKDLVKPYLFKAVKNRALNHLKRESRKSGLDELFDSYNNELAGSGNDEVINTVSFSNLQAELEAAIEELPEQRREIFRMSRYQHLKHSEIAEKLNLSKKTVETQIYRAIKSIREKLKHHLEG